MNPDYIETNHKYKLGYLVMMESSIKAIAAFSASLLADKYIEEVGSTLGEMTFKAITSLRQRTKKELEEDTRTRSVLNQLEASNYEEASNQTLEIIADTLEEKIKTNPDFAREAQESQKIFEQELQSNSSADVQEYLRQVKRLANKIEYLQKDIDDVKKEININVGRGDYLGQDRAILSGNNNIICNYGSYESVNYGGKIEGIKSQESIEIHLNTDFLKNEEYTDRILTQIEQIKGKTTQFLTVKESMDELDKIRQPRSISIDYIEQELAVSVPLSFLGDAYFRRLTRKKQKDEINQNKELISAENYFKKIREIESKLGKNPEEDETLLQSLGSIADEINLKISKLNNSFILALYPASSSKELVTNMVSKIGYKEIREEAETHLSVISKLVDKLNKLMEKFDIERLNNKQKSEIELSKNQNNIALIQALVNEFTNGNSEEIRNYFDLIKGLIKDSKNEKPSATNDNDKDNENIYVLSDEAQATIGIMIDIEKRRYLVEKLVRSDLEKATVTTRLVTIAIMFIISLMIIGGFFYGPLVTVGEKPLDNLKLPLLNIPWPVVFWSFIGSFAAMIYRFNRQPIYEFGNVLKWTITRLVQGIILGSAFYLILVSGLSLLTSEKITTEVIFILSFLVGFSDRFADSVFNTLIERYTKDARNKDKEKAENKSGS